MPAEGAKDGKGRGRQVIGTARTCDLVLIVLDAAKPMTHKRIIEKEMEGMGIRLNKKPPNITFTRKDKGGIAYRSLHTQPFLDEDTVKAIWFVRRLSVKVAVETRLGHPAARAQRSPRADPARTAHAPPTPAPATPCAATSTASTTQRSRCARRT